MDVELIFKIAAVGIIVAVLSQLLIRSGREEQAMLTTLAGLVVVLTLVISQISQLFRQRTMILVRSRSIRDHHHIKISLHDRLRNIQNIYIILGKICAYLRNDTHRILPHYCNDYLFHTLSFLHTRVRPFRVGVP